MGDATPGDFLSNGFSGRLFLSIRLELLPCIELTKNVPLLQPKVILDDLGKHRRRLLHLAQDSNLERGGPNLRIVQLALLLLMRRGGIETGFVEVGIGHQDERLNGHENLQERTRLWDPSGA